MIFKPRSPSGWNERAVDFVSRVSNVLTTLCFLLLACAQQDKIEMTIGGDVVLRNFSCATCRIVAESIAFLGHPDDTIAIVQNNVPAVDSRGRFFLASADGNAVIAFGPNGRVLSTFGEAGKGPGEFSGVHNLYVGAGDTIFVEGEGVVHLISPELKHVRQFSIDEWSPGGFQGTVLSDGRMLMSSENHVFTLVAADGKKETVRLKGTDTTPCVQCSLRAYREAVEPGSVWSGPANIYQVEQHTLAGEFVQRFVRETDWFKPWKVRGPGEAIVMEDASSILAEMTKPRFMAARQSSDRLVWTHTMVLDHPEQMPKNLDMENLDKVMTEIIRLMTSRVEVIDPVKKQLLVGTQFTDLTLPLSGDYTAQLVIDKQSTDWGWRIVRLRLVRQ